MKLPAILQKPLLVLACLLLRLLCRTLRWEIADSAGFTHRPPVTPSICVLWHNRILVMPYFSQRFAPRVQAAVLTSASRDGGILTQVVQHFGLGAVRGSSSRKGASALRELVVKVRGGLTVAVTPDGPRGPVYRCKPGMLHLALQTGAPLFLYGVNYERFWQMKSWDGFRIPKPFSKVRVRIVLPETPLSAETNFDAMLGQIEHEMLELNEVELQ